MGHCFDEIVRYSGNKRYYNGIPTLPIGLNIRNNIQPIVIWIPH